MNDVVKSPIVYRLCFVHDDDTAVLKLASNY